MTLRGIGGGINSPAAGSYVAAGGVRSDGVMRHTRLSLRQQRVHGDERSIALADFVAPRETGLADWVGAFAVTAGHGVAELVARYEREHDDYSAIMVKALADRLAEALAELVHERARRECGFGRDEGLSKQDLIDEKYRGIRPAPGYPACPDHTDKRVLWRLLDVEGRTGIQLTESLAMWPAASVSGFFFNHPQARYFSVGRLGEDQIADYARRKGVSKDEVERWLAASLGYEPGGR